MNVKPVLLKKTPNSLGEYPIVIYVSRDGKIYYYLKIYVNEKDWDKTGKVKNTRPNYIELNRIISNTKNDLEKLMFDNPTLNAKQIVEKYKLKGGGGSSITDFAEKFIKECKAGKIIRKPNTIKAYRTTCNNLKQFSEKGFSNYFEKVNIDWYENYCAFLRSKGLSENSVGKDIKTVKTFIQEAFERGITTTVEHRKKYFKVYQEASEEVYLNEAEVKLIESLDLSGNARLLEEQDRFIVSYYFLLRYSDSIDISKDNIIEVNGIKFLKKKAIKTGKEVIIPIKPSVYSILKRNKFKLQKDTNQEANRKIKEICLLAGVDKEKALRVTTHTARRSGATNLYIQSIKTGKPPVKLIMDLGGWKTEASFMLYIRVDKLDSAILAAELEHFK